VAFTPTAKWLTGRTREQVYTLDFTLSLEWAPIIVGSGVVVHFVKRCDLIAAADGGYQLAFNPTFGSGTRGPYVQIQPTFQLVAGSIRTVSASPYPPDSTYQYVWRPAGDPAGGWVEANRQVADYKWGWLVTIYPGDGASGGVTQFIDVSSGSPVTFWYIGTSLPATPGPLGATVYSASGVPSGVTIPPDTLRPAPDDWERTHGPTYSHSLTGTITFSGGTLEEYFLNLDQPSALDITGHAVPPAQVSELGSDDPDFGKLQWARQYTERRATGSVQSITVNLGALGTYSSTTAANASFPNSSFQMPFAQVNAFSHALGSTGSTVNASYSLTALWSAGGVNVSPQTVSYSDAGGSASDSGGTATTNALTGSSAWPSFPTYLPGGGPGGGQAERGGVKVGSAATQLKIPTPQTMVFNGQLLRLPSGAANDVPYDVQIDTYSSAPGTAPGSLVTISGVTSSFSRTFTYDDRASRGATRLGSVISRAGGGTTWYVAKSGFPDNAGVRLTGGNAPACLSRRMALRGRRWGLYNATLPDAADILIAPWPSYTLSATATASITGGILSLTGATGAGSIYFASGTLSTAPLPEYRYFTFRVRSVGSANQSVRLQRSVSVSIPTQHTYDWTITTGADGVWTTFDLDALASFGASISAGFITPALMSGFWTVTVPSGATVEIEYLKASKHTFARLDAVRGLWSTGGPALTGIVDGSPYYFTLAGTDTLASWLYGGWSLTPQSSPSGSKPWGHDRPTNANVNSGSYFPQAWFYDTDNWWYIAGGGLLYNPSSTSWEVFFNQEPAAGLGGTPSPGTSTTPEGSLAGLGIDCQDVYERVQVYPGAGDVFGHSGGNYGLTTTLQFGILLGAASTGLEVGDTDAGWPDVVAYDPTPTERARGTVAGPENYALLSPDLRSSVAYTWRLDPETDPTQYLTASPVDREIWRTIWALSADGKGLASLASADGWYALAAVETVSSTTGIRFRRCDHGVPDVPSGIRWPVLVFATTNAADKWPSLTLDPWGKLLLLYERSGAVYKRFSDDEGASWSDETMAFSAGKFPEQGTDHMTGTLLMAAVVASGSDWVIHGQVQHPGDAAPSAEFTFQYHDGTSLVDLKVKKSAFRLACGYEVQGRWNLACTVAGESDVSYWWCGDGEGRTWTRIT